MKKRTILLLSAIISLSAAAGAAAVEGIREIKAQLRSDFTVKIDNNVKHFKNADGEDVYPILYEGTTYLPIRSIGELMGKTVVWYEDEKIIELADPTESTVTDADIIVNTDSSDNAVNTKHSKKESDKAVKSDNNQIQDTSAFISKDKAKQIVLEKAGFNADEVTFKKINLDKEKQGYVYEIEFRKGFLEYEAEILAEDGTVISWETD